MSLSINIGTRNRPDNLRAAVKATLRNTRRGDTRILISVDDDDPLTIDSLDRLPKDERIKVSIRPREDSRGEKSDRVLTELPADVYMVCSDSASILTPGYDQLILDAANTLPDRIGVVNTAMCNASFPSLQAVTKEWVDIVGHIYCHDYPFWFIDHELDDLARMTGAMIFAEVDDDATPRLSGKTTRLRDVHFWADYYDLATFRRRVQAFRIIDRLDLRDCEKEMRKTWHHHVEARSVWINNSVRADAERLEKIRGETGEPDEGYLRAFERARQNIKAMKKELLMLAREAA